MARTRTLTELRTDARQRADMENSTFVSDTEATRYINLGVSKLYDLLLQARGDEYYMQRMDFTTTAGEELYPLPSNFYKLIAVDINDGASVFSAKPLEFQSERNTYQENAGWGRGFFPVKYMLQSSHIRFFPAPSSSHTITLWYVPHAPELGTTAVVQGNFSYTSGSKALTLTGGTDSATSVILTANETLGFVFQGSKINFASPPFTTTPRVTKVEGTTVYVDRPAEATGTTSGRQIDNPDQWDGINGWEEYVVVDAAIRMMSKEESDPSVLMADRQELEDRLTEIASQRDMGSPKKLQDVSREFFVFDDDVLRGY